MRPAARAATMAVVTSPEPCARCGGDADFDIASLWLCIDCYHIAGSTCAGIGRIPATATGPDAAVTTVVGHSTVGVAAVVLSDADQVC